MRCLQKPSVLLMKEQRRMTAIEESGAGIIQKEMVNGRKHAGSLAYVLGFLLKVRGKRSSKDKSIPSLCSIKYPYAK
jgi:hypothetical protein